MENLTNLNAANINPSRFKAEFDTEKWDGVTSEIRFLSVPWKRDYEHVIGWESEEARDAWFENEAEIFFELTTGWNFKSLEVWKPGLGTHSGQIRVEVPYEIAINCNFLAVEMGEQPVPSDPAPEGRREIYYYFLTSLNKISPNTTELYLELDTWTTYINSVNIDLMKLERGHYTHALTPASKYLANPLDNHYGITDPEPDLPAHKPLISSESFVSFSKSSPRVCIATTADFSKISELWKSISYSDEMASKYDEPTFDGVPEEEYWKTFRNAGAGHASLLGWYGFAPKPAVTEQKVAGQIAGIQVFSIDPEDYTSFIEFLKKYYPQIFKTIEGVFLLDSALIEEGDTFNFFDFSFKRVLQQNDPKLIQNLNLSKDLFDYDSEYADFAKLYTAQFAMIEVSNLNGERVEIAIEDVAESLEFYSRSCSAFPFLKLEAFINGIGGKERKTYAVKPWNDKNAELFQSDWERYKFDIEIPTYGVFVENATLNGMDYNIEKYEIFLRQDYDRWIDLVNLENAYENSLKSIGKSYENDIDSIDLGFDNEADSISNRLSEISNIFTNASLSIERNKDNAEDIREKDKSVATNSLWLAYHNATDSLNLDYYIAMKTASAENTNALATAATNLSNGTIQLNLEDTNTTQSIWTDYQIDQINANTAHGPEDYAINTVLKRKWETSRVIAQTSVKLNMMNMTNQANISILTGAMNSIGGLLSNPNPINALGSGISTVASGIDTLLWFSSEVENMGDQANLQNANTTVTLDYPDWNIQYSGISLGRLAYEAERDERNVKNIAIWESALDVALFQKELNEQNLDRTITANSDILEATNVLQTGIAGVNYDAAVYIRNQNKLFSEYIRDRVQGASERIRDLNYDALGIINVRDYNTDNEIATNTRDTSTDIMDVVEAINTRTKLVRKGVAERSKTIDEEITENNKDAAVEVNRFRLEKDSNTIYAAAMKNEIGAPQKVSENSGNAWIDSWGQRGLEVKVRRCSKATEKLAGDTFKLYGYYSPNVMLENPDLTINGKFTYWKAEDIWLNGTLINETNKEILRKAFLRGVTIWDNPNTIMTGGL